PKVQLQHVMARNQPPVPTVGTLSVPTAPAEV
ncbi:hypothetical protein ACO22_00681, partial [Paracoccidioides brasiliensis]